MQHSCDCCMASCAETVSCRGLHELIRSKERQGKCDWLHAVDQRARLFRAISCMKRDLGRLIAVIGLHIGLLYLVMQANPEIVNKLAPLAVSLVTPPERLLMHRPRHAQGRS